MRVWEITSGQTLHTFQGKQFSSDPVISIKSRAQDPATFAAGFANGSVKLAHIENKKVVSGFTGGHESAVETMDFSSIM